MDDVWEDFSAHLVQMQRHFNTNDVILADRLATRGYDYLLFISAVRSRIYQSVYRNTVQRGQGQRLLQDTILDLDFVVNVYEQYLEHFQSICDRAIEPPSLPRCSYASPTGITGRPSYAISPSQIEAMTDLGLNFEQMAAILGVSSRTIRRRRQLFGLPCGRNYTDIEDDDLDTVVTSILHVSHCK